MYSHCSILPVCYSLYTSSFSILILFTWMPYSLNRKLLSQTLTLCLLCTGTNASRFFFSASTPLFSNYSCIYSFSVLIRSEFLLGAQYCAGSCILAVNYRDGLSSCFSLSPNLLVNSFSAAILFIPPLHYNHF